MRSKFLFLGFFFMLSISSFSQYVRCKKGAVYVDDEPSVLIERVLRDGFSLRNINTGKEMIYFKRFQILQ